MGRTSGAQALCQNCSCEHRYQTRSAGIIPDQFESRGKGWHNIEGPSAGGWSLDLEALLITGQCSYVNKSCPEEGIYPQ